MTNILETVLTLSVLLLPFLDCWHKYLRFIELFPVFSSDLLSASECWFRNGNCCSCLSAPRLLLSAMFVWSRNVRFCPFLSVYVTHHVRYFAAHVQCRDYMTFLILVPKHVDMCWGACRCCILVPRVLLSIHVAQRCNGCFKERFTITTLHQADTRAKRQWGRDSAWKTTRSKSCQCIHVLQVSNNISSYMCNMLIMMSIVWPQGVCSSKVGTSKAELLSAFLFPPETSSPLSCPLKYVCCSCQCQLHVHIIHHQRSWKYIWEFWNCQCSASILCSLYMWCVYMYVGMSLLHWLIGRAVPNVFLLNTSWVEAVLFIMLRSFPNWYCELSRHMKRTYSVQ